MKVGIQGGVGSTNQRAAEVFAQLEGWVDYQIEYLFTTENVLHHVNEGKVDLGVFAWESTVVGVVHESALAVKKYDFEKLAEVKLQLDHALLVNLPIDESQTVYIYSHPQALMVHEPFLLERFSKCELREAKDTAVAAEKLIIGEYPPNSLVVAPMACAGIYGLDLFLSDEAMPKNKGYVTTFHLVRKKR